MEADRRDLERLAEGVLVAVPRAIVAIRKAVRGHAHSESTILHLRVALALRDGPATVSQLAELAGATPGAVSKLVATWDKAGFVARRHATEDRRFVALALTPEGGRHVDALLAAARAALVVRLQGLGQAEAAELDRALTVLAERFAIGDSGGIGGMTAADG